MKKEYISPILTVFELDLSQTIMAGSPVGTSLYDDYADGVLPEENL